MIQFHRELYSSFILSEIRPGKQFQAKVDSRRVNAIQGILKSEPVACAVLLCLFQRCLKQAFIQLLAPITVCV
jgi:hypothetical protein